MRLMWNQLGEKIFETGVDRGVLYLPNAVNVSNYGDGVAWNGLTAVNRSYLGAIATPYYVDGIMYLNVVSTEEFGAVLEAYTYPDEFAQFDGAGEVEIGLFANEQTRNRFGLSYRTQVGNDVDSRAHGYKIHLIYGAVAIPTQQSYRTFSDSPEATIFSWNITATPVLVPGFKRAASLTVDSTRVDRSSLHALEDILYGSPEASPRLPMPVEVASIISTNQNPDVIMTESNDLLLVESDTILLRESV